MKSFRDLESGHEVSYHYGSLLSCVLFVNLLFKKRERAPRFLGTLREHDVSTASCVLVGLVEGCKYSLSNFLS